MGFQYLLYVSTYSRRVLSNRITFATVYVYIFFILQVSTDDDWDIEEIVSDRLILLYFIQW